MFLQVSGQNPSSGFVAGGSDGEEGEDGRTGQESEGGTARAPGLSRERR